MANKDRGKSAEPPWLSAMDMALIAALVVTLGWLASVVV